MKKRIISLAVVFVMIIAIAPASLAAVSAETVTLSGVTYTYTPSEACVGSFEIKGAELLHNAMDEGWTIYSDIKVFVIVVDDLDDAFAGTITADTQLGEVGIGTDSIWIKSFYLTAYDYFGPNDQIPGERAAGLELYKEGDAVSVRDGEVLYADELYYPTLNIVYKGGAVGEPIFSFLLLTKEMAKEAKETGRVFCQDPGSEYYDEEYAEIPQLREVLGGETAQAGEIPSGIVAAPTTSLVTINSQYKQFEAYLINDYNYFKLRDLAYALNDTDSSFEVGYDPQTKAITLTSGMAYTPVGGEMSEGDWQKKTAEPTVSQVYKDGVPVDVTAYFIGGNNYFKLRDVMKLFDIGVTYNEITRNIEIDTSVGYTD